MKNIIKLNNILDISFSGLKRRTNFENNELFIQLHFSPFRGLELLFEVYFFFMNEPHFERDVNIKADYIVIIVT